MISAGDLLSIFIILCSLHLPAQAQNCYYPNGDVALGMGACAPEGGSCCPYQWECLSNGLCYLDNAEYYGRYTCTDQDWASDSQCPNYCTQNNTAAGNEAIQHCPDDSWCCDSNRDPKKNCCDSSNAEVLDLGSASTVAFISSTAPPTSLTSSSTSSGSASSTRSATTSSTFTSISASSTTRPPPTTITTSAVTSNSAGVATTIFSIITSTPAPTANPAPSWDGSNRSLIIGLGVGVPAAVLASTALAFLLWRRRRAHKVNEKPSLFDTPGLVSMYRSTDDTPELDSASPHSKPDRKSELYGSTPSQVPHSPAVSSITAGSGPPHYSPTIFVGPGGALGQVQEEPSELWGSEIPAQQWPGQQPYRAPEPEQRMSQTFRVSQQDFAPYRPPQADATSEKVTLPRDY